MTTTLENATIRGHRVSWDALVAAAQQDRVSTETDHRGCPRPPNGDTALADAYRQVLRDLLPEVKALRDQAYARYVGQGVTTRSRSAVTSIGHGSWVAGPDPNKQGTWQAWEQLVRRITAAAAIRA